MLIDYLLSAGTRKLADAGIASSRLDARLLLQCATGKSHEYLLAHAEHDVACDEQIQYMSHIARRSLGEPVAYITGLKEFWGLDFIVNESVLIPRPESELLVEVLVSFTKERTIVPSSILDIGVGSGCLLLSLLSIFDKATGLGVDIAEDALYVAKQNASKLGLQDRVHFSKQDVFGNLTEKFDVIISNPPYIPYGDRVILAKDIIDFEPDHALFGGDTGMDFYAKIISQVGQFIRPGGIVVLECGIKQADTVVGMLRNTGVRTINIFQDLAGIDRCVLAYFDHL